MSDPNSYPRMLFREDGATSRADSREEMLAKRAQGWRATLLPSEEPKDIGDEPATEVRVADARPGEGPAETVAPPTRGRPKKQLAE